MCISHINFYGVTPPSDIEKIFQWIFFVAKFPRNASHFLRMRIFRNKLQQMQISLIFTSKRGWTE